MSLKKCPNCNHKISWFKIYKKINKKRFQSEKLLNCKKCHYKLGMKKKEKTLIQKLLCGFMWMFVPILLIVFVSLGKLNFMVAIVLVIMYHFIAMDHIISNYNYSSVKK